jgi:RNA polymerase sigma-70 factor (ECF subfamily)
VQSDPAVPDASAATQREVVTAFLAASREGDFAGLLRLLDPHVVLRADPTVVGFGAAAEVRGPDGVARTFAGQARAAKLMLVDGLAGAVWSLRGRPQVVFGFTVRGGRVASIELLGDPETLDVLDLEPVRLSGRARPPGPR